MNPRPVKARRGRSQLATFALAARGTGSGSSSCQLRATARRPRSSLQPVTRRRAGKVTQARSTTTRQVTGKVTTDGKDKLLVTGPPIPTTSRNAASAWTELEFGSASTTRVELAATVLFSAHHRVFIWMNAGPGPNERDHERCAAGQGYTTERRRTLRRLPLWSR